MTGAMGGAGTFGELVEPLLGPAYGTALRLTGNASDAEDLVQDAVLLALRGFGSFRQGSNFRAWFFRILMNRFFSDYRRRRRRGTPVDVAAAPEAEVREHAELQGLIGEPDEALAVLGRLDAALIERALDALPDEYRDVSSLYFMQDFTYQEIAEMLEVPIGTVRSRLHRARKLLQASLWPMARASGVLGGRGAEEPA